jgi:hypothetical protein
MQSDKKKNRGYNVVAIGPNVSCHAPEGSSCQANGGNRSQDADSEQRADTKGAPGGCTPLFVNKTDDQWNTGKVTRTKDDTENAPHKSCSHGDEKRTLDRAGQYYKKFLHAA